MKINRSNTYESMEKICATAIVDEATFKPYPCDVKDTAVIFFTSGTTNFPKGICLSHESILRSGYPANVPPHMVFLQQGSIAWITAGTTLAISLISGCKLLLGSNVPVERTLYLIAKYKVVVFMCSITFFNSLLSLDNATIAKYDLSHLKSIFLIGCAFSPARIRQLQELLPHVTVATSYGSTEAGGVISILPNVRNSNLEDKIGSAGKVSANMEVKIVDPESQKLLSPYQEGEILVKTPNQMIGYYLGNGNCDLYDTEGFLRTGDLGYYDQDEFLYVTDRLNTTFKYQTTKVSPIFIENILRDHPAVEEAVVFGVPNEIDFFHPAAAVVLRKDENISKEDLIRYVDDKMPDYCKLRGGVKIFDKFPITPSGKIQRRTVRQMFIKSISDM